MVPTAARSGTISPREPRLTLEPLHIRSDCQPSIDRSSAFSFSHSYLILLLLDKMAPSFTHEFDHAGYKGKVEIPTGLYIDGEWTESVDKNAKTIE